jgi:zinc/manganese transport system substrate-binding protein
MRRLFLANRVAAGFLGVLALCVLLILPVLAGCATAAATGRSGVIEVVAGENFWGSIAAQLGGSRVQVTSIVTDPNADPHEYESNTGDARAFAVARYVILNGAGYDTWAQKLLDANPVSGRKVLTVADLLGKHEGDNPHFWYNPDDVERVIGRIAADLTVLDPAGASYFSQQRAGFETALKPYHNRIAAIKAKFAGQKVGATETIFVYLADSLGLDLISPPELMQAVAEGNDPPASSVAQFQQQITSRQITVLVYNVQTVTAVTTNLKQLAGQQNIPIVGISETMQPPDATFQQWQLAQLLTLGNALNANTLGK